MIASHYCNQNQNNNDDDDDSWPLVSRLQQRQNFQLQTPSSQMQQQRGSATIFHGQGLLFLSASRLVGLFLLAFVVGALIPIVLWDDPATQPPQSQNNASITTTPTMQKQQLQPIWNNLRPSSSQSTINSNETRGLKIAWRKCDYPCFCMTHIVCLFVVGKVAAISMRVGWIRLNSSSPTLLVSYNSFSHTLPHLALFRSVPFLASNDLGTLVMSFPNSGTSFTLDLVTAASNMSMATNYGWEQAGTGVADSNNYSHNESINNSTAPFGITVPIFPSDTPAKGPFWIQPLEKHPRVAVLTKTHCGGYCHDCRPHKSVESPHSFMMHCAMSEVQRMKTIVRSMNTTNNTDLTASDGEDEEVDFEEKVITEHHVYDYNDIDRAVHLFRDPMDNMVSRYHLGVHKVTKQNKTELIQRYTYDAAGFTNFCWDKTYFHDEQSESHVDQDVLQLIQDVPCHMDLFRYIQWHNLAFIVTDDYLNLPTHIVHYEDYNSNMEATLQSLLDFLELPNTGAEYPFQSGKSYRYYFTDDQIARMRTATMMLASPLTWHYMERYF